MFYVFFQICFPCVLRTSLRATLYTKTAMCFMFFSRFVFRVCCERPCEQLCIPKLRFVRPPLRPRSAVIQVLCERLAVPKLRCSGALRATSSTNTAIVRCLASVPVGPCLVLFSLCARAHFFCFHPKIAVPCIILTLGPVTSRCLRRPCWVLRAACSTKTAMNHIRSQKMFFFSFFFREFCEQVPVPKLRFVGPDCEQNV